MLAHDTLFADAHRIAILAETLDITPDQVNAALAAYLPRDTVEVSMIGRIMVLEQNLHQATRAARDPALTTLQADRLRRTVCTIDRQLERLSVRLEKRQFQTRGLLPQQYWRETPIQAVGPFDQDATPPSQTENPPIEDVPAKPLPIGNLLTGNLLTEAPPAEQPAVPMVRTATRHHPDDPSSDGDALYQLARMRIGTDHDPAHIRALAEREAQRAQRAETNRGRAAA